MIGSAAQTPSFRERKTSMDGQGQWVAGRISEKVMFFDWCGIVHKFCNVRKDLKIHGI